MDNQVRVVMNGRMVPISVDVKDGALKDARVSHSVSQSCYAHFIIILSSSSSIRLMLGMEALISSLSIYICNIMRTHTTDFKSGS